MLGAFVPFGQRVRRAFDIMFDPCTGDDVTIGVTTKHKEEGVRRRDLDTADRNLVMHELKTHAHPLTDKASDLVNIVNRKVADKRINVVDAVSIGEEMSLDFVKSLPDGFHNRLTNTVVPATAGPLGERPPALAGHFCNVGLPTTLPC